jgi:hypothetical protein
MAPQDPPVVTAATTLARLIGELETRERYFLPDLDVSLRRLRMTSEGTIELPGVGVLATTEWSWAQFSRVLGFTERYFQHATPAEKAEELNRRLTRSHRAVRLRIGRHVDGVGNYKTDGTLRAIVSRYYTSVPDSVVASVLAEVVGKDVPVVRVATTDRSTSFVVKVADPIQSGVAIVGDVMGTMTFRNSDVGASSLFAALSLFRLFCLNGMLLPEPRAVVLNRRHLGLREDEIRTSLVERLRDLPGRFQRGASALVAATRKPVENVEAEVRGLLKEAHLPVRLVPPIMAAHAIEPLGNTVFALSQALGRAAQNLRPEEGLQLEVVAANYVRRSVGQGRRP